jgi:hypothetical protein
MMSPQWLIVLLVVVFHLVRNNKYTAEAFTQCELVGCGVVGGSYQWVTQLACSSGGYIL